MWPRVKYGLTEVCGWSRTHLEKSCDHGLPLISLMDTLG